MGQDKQHEDGATTFVERLRAETENFEDACAFTVNELIESYREYGSPALDAETYKDYCIEQGWPRAVQFGEIVSGTLTRGAVTAEQVQELAQFLHYVPADAGLSIDIRGRDITFVADGGRDSGEGPCVTLRVTPPVGETDVE